ncbi:MAG: hypothetical protein JST00_45385 [Deltaproteobacteria bacterium]|nr:hypothetical protein [Deltaproteobacteria bacterium]
MADDKDDDLLRALGRVAADQARATAPYERMTTGAATKEELDELARLEESGDEETKGLVAAARPLDDAARARIADTLAAKMAPRRRAALAWGRIGAAGGAIALAAAVALLVTRPTATAPLPRYSVDSTSVSTMRMPSDPGATNDCTLQSSEWGAFEVVIRPDAELRGGVSASMFVWEGSTTKPWAGDFEVAPTGSIRIRGTKKSLLGATSLVIVVGRPAAFADRALAKARSAPSGEGWQAITCAVVPAAP